MAVLVACGTWDGLHEGHVQLLTALKRLQGGVHDVMIFVNSDAMIRKRKPGLELMNDEYARIQSLRKRYPSFHVHLAQDLDTLKEYLSRLHPILFHGDDYDIGKLSELYGVDRLWWDDNAVTLAFIPRTTGMSSTLLRELRRDR